VRGNCTRSSVLLGEPGWGYYANAGPAELFWADLCCPIESTDDTAPPPHMGETDESDVHTDETGETDETVVVHTDETDETVVVHTDETDETLVVTPMRPAVKSPSTRMVCPEGHKTRRGAEGPPPPPPAQRARVRRSSAC
jgi:hypothetical protein